MDFVERTSGRVQVFGVLLTGLLFLPEVRSQTPDPVLLSLQFFGMLATKELTPPPEVVDEEPEREPEQTMTTSTATATEEDLASRLAALGGDPNVDLLNISSSLPEPELKTFDAPPATVVDGSSAPAENSLIVSLLFK